MDDEMLYCWYVNRLDTYNRVLKEWKHKEKIFSGRYPATKTWLINEYIWLKSMQNLQGYTHIELEKVEVKEEQTILNEIAEDLKKVED